MGSHTKPIPFCLTLVLQILFGVRSSPPDGLAIPEITNIFSCYFIIAAGLCTKSVLVLFGKTSATLCRYWWSEVTIEPAIFLYVVSGGLAYGAGQQSKLLLWKAIAKFHT